MNIDWAVTCRYAESDGVVATMVGAGVDIAFLPQFPSPIGVMVAARLAASADELAPGQVHPFRCRVLDSHGQPAVDVDGVPLEPMEVGIGSQVPVQQIVPGWLVNPLLAFGVQWMATEPMTYTIELSVDGGEPHLSPYHVVSPPQQPLQP